MTVWAKYILTLLNVQAAEFIFMTKTAPDGHFYPHTLRFYAVAMVTCSYGMQIAKQTCLSEQVQQLLYD